MEIGTLPPVARLESNHWTTAHAVNSKDRLARFLSAEINIAEGDVSLSNHGETIMAHPPDKESDLSLQEWIRSALEHHRAIKVDMKEPGVIGTVEELLKAAGFPEAGLIISADALIGPGGRDPLFTISDLAGLRKLFPEAVISIGSTLSYKETLSYGASDVENFLKAKDTLGGPVTFCLRLDMFLKNPGGVAALLSEHHVTIWNSIPKTPADAEILSAVKKHVSRGFIDLMDADGAPVV